MTNDTPPPSALEALERLKADLELTCPEGSRWKCALVDKNDLRILFALLAHSQQPTEGLGGPTEGGVPKPLLASERAALKRKVFLGLTLGQLASCSCNTKTPEARFHHEDCPYRPMKEAEEALEALAPEPLPTVAGKECK